MIDDLQILCNLIFTLSSDGLVIYLSAHQHYSN